MARIFPAIGRPDTYIQTLVYLLRKIAESRKKDRNKAFVMILQAVAVGLITGIVAYILGIIVAS